MIRITAHHVVNDFDVPYRTEDVKFSPSGRRLAVAATDGCLILYAVDVKRRPVELVAEVELRSPALLVPHGVDFLSEDVLVVANRNGNLVFFRVPAPDQWHSPCTVTPLLEVQSHLFGATGVTRKLRERDLYCGPGSVRLLDGILYVCCNYTNTVSTFTCQLDQDGVKVQEGSVIAQEGLEVVDGIAISQDGSLMALSDHDHHRVAVYRRTKNSTKDKPHYELTCSLTDIDMHYAHGLRFDHAARNLYVADAGGLFIHVFSSIDGWKTDATASTVKTQGVDTAAFTKSQEVVRPEHRMLEGGAKGLDIDPAGKLIAVTCRNQVLRFLEIQDMAQPEYHAPAAISSLRANETEVALSCLVDDTPAIWDSLIPWLATATTLAEIHPANIHIHHVCPLHAEIAGLCNRLGIQTHLVEAFDARNPYANKIVQGNTQFGQVKSVMLMDVDMVFTTVPPFSQVHGLVAGKPVDKPNPPLSVLQTIFKAANIEFLGICSSQFVKNGAGIAFETLLGNFNGGMYIIPPNLLTSLAQRWAYWTRWLIDNVSLLANWGKHADQVGFSLAASELRLPLRILDNLWNYPTHIEQHRMHAAPWVLHHHARLDKHGQLLPVSSPLVQELVYKINGVIRNFRRLHGL